jgi:hypothetical protein
MYMLDGGAPFRRDASGAVFDAAGERIKLLGDTLKVRCGTAGGTVGSTVGGTAGGTVGGTGGNADI